MKKVILLALIVIILVSGCIQTGHTPSLPGDNEFTNETETAPDNPIPVASITLNPTSKDLEVNDTFQLMAVILPANATNNDVEWRSCAPDKASVSATGLVTALDNGTAKITASTADGTKTASATVTITTPVTGVSLSPSLLQLKVGQTGRFTVTLSPETASNQELTWSSTKPEVAEVDSLGQVTARGNGNTTIVVQTNSGDFTASAQITVTTPVSGVSLNKAALSLKTGQTAQLTASVAPGNASERGVVWSSSNKQVAAVSSGLVTAKGKGTAVITVTTKDGGWKAAATVTVTEPEETGTADELLMLNMVNDERQRAGLEPLKFNLKLTEVARAKSQDMIDNNYFAHESPVYGSPFEMMKQFDITYRYAAENLALHPSVESAHQGLMNSEGHRANILNDKLTEIGIGIIRNGKGQYYVTQMFIGF